MHIKEQNHNWRAYTYEKEKPRMNVHTYQETRPIIIQIPNHHEQNKCYLTRKLHTKMAFDRND